MVWTGSTTAWLFCTSGSAVFKAGENADATAIADATNLAIISQEVQGRIISETRRDWATTYTSLPNGIKDVLSLAASCAIANHIIKSNPSGFFPGEAELLINVNYDTYKECMEFLTNFKSNSIQTP